MLTITEFVEELKTNLIGQEYDSWKIDCKVMYVFRGLCEKYNINLSSVYSKTEHQTVKFYYICNKVFNNIELIGIHISKKKAIKQNSRYCVDWEISDVKGGSYFTDIENVEDLIAKAKEIEANLVIKQNDELTKYAEIADKIMTEFNLDNYEFSQTVNYLYKHKYDVLGKLKDLKPEGGTD